jgi:hypothetical protein
MLSTAKPNARSLPALSPCLTSYVRDIGIGDMAKSHNNNQRCFYHNICDYYHKQPYLPCSYELFEALIESIVELI